MTKRVCVIVLIATVHGLLNAVFHLPTAMSSVISISRHYAALLSVFAPEIPLDPREFYQMILFLLPLQIVAVTASENMADEIGRFGVYVFTRHSSRRKWYSCLTGKIAMASMLYAATYTLLSTLVFIPGMLAPGYPVGWWRSVSAYLAITSLFLASLMVLANLLVLAFGMNIAAIMTIGGTSVAAAVAFIAAQGKSHLTDWIVRLNPVANGIMDWHEHIGFQHPVQGQPAFTVHYSLLFYLALFAVIWGLGFLYVRKRDIC